VEIATGSLMRWLVTMGDGATVEVWADSAQGVSGPEDDRDYVFGVLVEVDEEEQAGFEVLARTPGHPRLVEVAVARFSRHSVRSVASG
jgi:hypothetical protein